MCRAATTAPSAVTHGKCRTLVHHVVCGKATAVKMLQDTFVIDDSTPGELLLTYVSDTTDHI